MRRPIGEQEHSWPLSAQDKSAGMTSRLVRDEGRRAMQSAGRRPPKPVLGSGAPGFSDRRITTFRRSYLPDTCFFPRQYLYTASAPATAIIQKSNARPAGLPALGEHPECILHSVQQRLEWSVACCASTALRMTLDSINTFGASWTAVPCSPR